MASSGRRRVRGLLLDRPNRSRPKETTRYSIGTREDPSRAVKNVRTEVNRIVSQSFNWKSDKSAQVEAVLKEQGIISVAELQQRFRKEYKAIIKRGQVAGLVEYYMAKEIVDSGSIGTKGNRERGEVMITVFEQAHVAKTAKPK